MAERQSPKFLAPFLALSEVPSMKISSLLLLLALAVAAGFAVLNWSTLITPTELSLGFTTAQIPLGLVMLGLLIFVTALFLVYVVYLQSSALLETRRHSRELQANRELAIKRKHHASLNYVIS
jgi:uncharacterized integral membrane protein